MLVDVLLESFPIQASKPTPPFMNTEITSTLCAFLRERQTVNYVLL